MKYSRFITGRALVLSIVSSLLFACAPVYEQRYEFDAPEGIEAQRCILDCETEKLRCLQAEHLRFAQCQNQASFDYYRCAHHRIYRYDRRGYAYCIANCFCDQPFCSLHLEPCSETYRSCFKVCGGEVRASRVCIRNCEERDTPETATAEEEGVQKAQ